MGDLQSQQDSPLQPYGHDPAAVMPLPGSSTSRALVWAGVAAQVLAFGVLIGEDRDWLPNHSAEFVVQYAWVGSAAALAMSIAGWLRVRKRLRSLDVVGFTASLTLSGVGGLFWAFFAHAFARVGV